ncbi:MAG TPA: hypothetical protein VIY49_08335 [Bryobacteraceae bacterium]
MAQDERTKVERTKVKFDEFVAKVVPDPKKPGEALLLTGFLGASPDPKYTRIYWDPSLSSYADINSADIIHTEPLPKEQSPLGGAYVWVRRSAEVTMGSGGSQTAKGKFFEGPLMSAYGSMFSGAAGSGAGAGAAAILVTVACPTRGGCATPWCPPTNFPLPCGIQTAPIHGACTLGFDCNDTPGCPVFTIAGCFISAACPIASEGCPPLLRQGWAGGQAAAAVAPQIIPSLVCSYNAGCWFSWNACPTLSGCGPHFTPRCPI